MRSRERGTGFVRLLQMVELLRRRQMTLLELADEFHVSRRTIIRDLLVLERAGALVDLQCDRDGIDGYCYSATEARP